MTPHDLAGVAAVLAASIAMLFSLRAARGFALLSPERTRKIAHVGTGALTLTFPWIFSSYVPVFLACGLAVLLLLAIRYYTPLRAQLSSVLHSVDRSSDGELYFPASVAVIFYLANGDRLLYAIPILVLTLADTVAALLGSNYGKTSYASMGGKKSLEGSVAFFTVAFLSVHIPLLLFTQLDRPQTLLIALDIAVLVSLFEAIAWRGLDNIFIPFGVFLLLHMYTAFTVRQLLARAVVAVFLLLSVYLYRARTTLETSALLGAVLVLYASWAIGSWLWFLAPAALFLTYSLFYPGKTTEIGRHNVYAVASVASSGLLWLFIAHITSSSLPLFVLYAAAYAMHLAMIGWTLRRLHHPLDNHWKRGPFLVALSWALMFLPYLLARHFHRAALLQSFEALCICALGFLVFCLIEPREEGIYTVTPNRWIRQATIVLLACVLLAGMESIR